MQDSKLNKNESGRSMVEMLGVLAIIGVLSVGGIGGYTTAMNKHRANELLNQASQRAMIIMAQLTQGRPMNQISLSGFSNNSIGGASFAQTPQAVGTNKYALPVNNVDEAICRNLVGMTGGNISMAKQSSLATTMTAEECKDTDAIAFIFESDDFVINQNTPSTSSSSTTSSSNSSTTCNHGEQRCDGDIVQSCNNGSWEEYTTCNTHEYCSEFSSGTAGCLCYTNSFRCNGNILENCNGVGWSNYEECAYGCLEASSGAAWCNYDSSGSCSDGALRCVNGSTGAYVEQCSSNSWNHYESCSNSCIEASGSAWCGY